MMGSGEPNEVHECPHERRDGAVDDVGDSTWESEAERERTGHAEAAGKPWAIV